MKPSFTHEDACGGIVCGIDEVGRGPLAGPVVAAAVVLKRDRIPPEALLQINDSKKLTPAKREYLAEEIKASSFFSIAECSVEEIDTLNIYHATFLAMKKAYQTLCRQMKETPPTAVLVDGNRAPKIEAPVIKTLVGGDALSYSIAAASIVAKHYRDQLMRAYAREFPEYQWERNAGYGTAAHLKAIETHGITPLHRRSFAPISRFALSA